MQGAQLHSLLVALAHEVADPPKGDEGEDASLGFWAHLFAVHILPVGQHLHHAIP